MRALIVCVLGLVAARGAVASGPPDDPLRGRWQGAFVRENAVQIAEFTFDTAPDGSLRGTCDIPDLGMYESALREVKREGNALSFRCIYGLCELVVHEPVGQMTGGNPRWKPAIALHLKKIGADPARLPAQPVSFESGGLRLRGEIILPPTGAARAAAVLLHGSDERSRTTTWYRARAAAYAHLGIAVLAFDMRGQGESEGDTDAASMQDLGADAASAARFLKSRPEFRDAPVGLIGPSQGAWPAAWAAPREPAVAFLILTSAPAVGVHAQELQRVECQGRSAGLEPGAAREAIEFTRLMLGAASDPARRPDVLRAAEGLRATPVGDLVSIPESDADFDWWARNTYDPAEDLARVRVPVLVLYGEADDIVPPDLNEPIMRNALAGGPGAVIRRIPGVGHALLTSQFLANGEVWQWPNVFWVWSRKPPEVDGAISAWLAEQGLVSPPPHGAP